MLKGVALSSSAIIIFIKIRVGVLLDQQLQQASFLSQRAITLYPYPVESRIRRPRVPQPIRNQPSKSLSPMVRYRAALLAVSRWSTLGELRRFIFTWSIAM